MCSFEESLPGRLVEYLRPYRRDFRRRDQAAWAAVYLQGLLSCPERKTVENLARTVQLSAGPSADNIAQALQHFVNQSPWDEACVWRRYLTLAAGRLSADGLLVAAESVFVKQGRHSVGVQRQHSHVLGRKANCQIAVVLYHTSPTGCIPLVLRLYLPRGWLLDSARLDAAGVPQGARRPLSRTGIALELLDAVRTAGVRSSAVALPAGWSLSEDFEQELTLRGLALRVDVQADVQEAVSRIGRRLQERLGLSHFEGRSWRGFHHHACLVMLAHDFLATQTLPGEATCALAGNL